MWDVTQCWLGLPPKDAPGGDFSGARDESMVDILSLKKAALLAALRGPFTTRLIKLKELNLFLAY